jgi:hypothetical protein
MAIEMTLECAICGGPFVAVVIRKRPRFCGPECKALRQGAQRKRYHREGRYAPATVEKTCVMCGGTFRTVTKDQPTCGRTCGAKLAARTTGPSLAAKARARNERPCPVCERLFVPANPSARQRRAGYVQQTCGDRSCMREMRARAGASALPSHSGAKSAPRSAARARRPHEPAMPDLFGPLRGPEHP